MSEGHPKTLGGAFWRTVLKARYELLIKGNSLSFRGGFFGLCNVALVTAEDGTRILLSLIHI